MQRIYISGPMSNLPGLNKAAFASEAGRLRDLGYEVVNPGEVALPDGTTWAQYMRHDLKLLLDCDTIFMLPGWERSNGALIEHVVAVKLGMKVIIAAGRSPFSSAPVRTDWAAA